MQKCMFSLMLVLMVTSTKRKWVEYTWVLSGYIIVRHFITPDPKSFNRRTVLIIWNKELAPHWQISIGNPLDNDRPSS